LVVSVRDAASGRSVPHAFVVAERATLLGITDASGVLRARVASGSHGVEVRSFGYVARKFTVIIVADTTTSLDGRLTQAARSLDTVKVETDEPAPSVLGDFERRRATTAAHGFFLTRSQLDSLRNQSLSQVLRSRASDAKLVSAGEGGAAEYLASTRTRRRCPQSCVTVTRPAALSCSGIASDNRGAAG
jgi:hypothetical protein